MNFNERFPAARRAKRRFRGNRKSGSPLAHRVASYQPRASAEKEIIRFLFTPRLGEVFERNLMSSDESLP